ncbi:bidirectional sugar transporter SWEET12-like [Cucurbita maxima]|uniref:Bidirectional sugar transporter SWEET n=2 Tax=Cucurbita maxima TaxID=3661 RepID=A0A6J1JMS3_CUCMA|nr:bidirectional sugar transporter SWEET12-like [Cucurbita maxima]XP_022988611.1 bidirectional sugar transporter SWEET12-like [Cucurbita maxima]
MALSFMNHNPWIFAFGLLGNIFSFIVFLAPVPTFVRVCRKKSTEGFQSIPYVVALFSALLLIYYSTLNADEFFLMTINSVGCFIETIYIALYIAYAPKKARTFTVRFFLLLDVVGFCSILAVTQFLVKRPYRARVIGFICGGLSVSVFAAPLSIMRRVIRTKSVEFMPFNLSFFLTLSAVMWLCYGLLLKDFYVALPNTLGFTFGMAQMILYAIYRKPRGGSEVKLPQHKADIETVTKSSTSLESPEEHEKEGEGQEAAPGSNGEHAPPALACSNDKYCMDNIQAPPMIRCEA